MPKEFIKRKQVLAILRRLERIEKEVLAAQRKSGSTAIDQQVTLWRCSITDTVEIRKFLLEEVWYEERINNAQKKAR